MLLPALDALRGVAVLAVFAQHLGDTHLPFVRARVEATLPPALAPWLLTVLHHAHWGVDLFFVLSGFSLAQPLLARLARAGTLAEIPAKQADPGSIAPLARAARSAPPSPLAPRSWARSFFVRRAARIYPGYLAALALVIAAAPALSRHPSFPASLAAHLALVQGYVTPGGLALIGAAWSLTTEITFYAAWPLLAPLALRGATFAPPGRLSGPPAGAHPEATTPKSLPSPAPSVSPSAPSVSPPAPVVSPISPSSSRRNPWLLPLALVALAWLTRAILHELALRPSAPPWLLEASQRRWAVSRVDQFLLGALAAALHARLLRGPHASRARALAAPLFALSLLALPAAFYLEGTFHGRPLGAWPYALVSLVTTALVLTSATLPDAAANRLFPRPLRFAGVVSYGVFLNHQLALGATAHLSGPAGTWSSLALHASLALALSLLLGWLSWIAVERPVIEWASKRERARSDSTSRASSV